MEIVRPLFVLFAFCSLFFLMAFIFRLVLNNGWRLATIQTFIVVGGLVWAITEILSVFRAITFIGLAVSWGSIYLITFLVLMYVSKGNLKNIVLKEFSRFRKLLKSLPKGVTVLLACESISLLTLGLVAFVAAPNTWDSMTYHLSRVMHWQQNQSLAFYPTSIERQLHLGPLAEMAILNFQILVGDDHLANFVQFFAMIGCIAGGSLITKRLGGDVHAQLFSVVAITTLPMGVLQATSTQNDYVVALWLVCFVMLMLEYLQEEKPFWIIVLLMGGSLGLAILTKVTALLFGISFGLWLTFGLVRRLGMNAWKHLAILLCVALIIFTSHASRNYKLYSNLLGPMVESGSMEYKYTNDSYGVAIITSNILRNIAIHFALPFQSFNSIVEKTILLLHIAIKIDINDPKSTWPGTFFSVNYSLNETLAGNPFHLFLIVISTISLIYYRKTELVVYTVCVATGFFLFIWLLKWQPWHSRLHLPLFVLALPLTGLFTSKYLNRNRQHMVMITLFILALPIYLQNPTRPLLGANNIMTLVRTEQYFANRPDYFVTYQKQIDVINDLRCSDIGLITKGDDWEYPIWVMLNTHGIKAHIEHIFVDGPSGRISTMFVPCAIISTFPFQEKVITVQNTKFYKYREEKQISVFVPFVP